MQSFLARSAVNPESKPKNTHILSKQMGLDHINTQKLSLSLSLSLSIYIYIYIYIYMYSSTTCKECQKLRRVPEPRDRHRHREGLIKPPQLLYNLFLGRNKVLALWASGWKSSRAKRWTKLLTMVICSPCWSLPSPQQEEEKLWILLTPPLRPTPAWGPTKPFSSFP